MIGGVLADREKHRLGAFVGQRLEHGGGVARPRTVVEGQHHFLVGEKVELLEMLEAETRAARGVDFNHAADAERIGIGANGFRRHRRNRRLVGNGGGGLDIRGCGGGLGGSRGGLRGGDGLRRGMR